MIIFQTAEFLASFIEALLGISINAKTLDGERFKMKDNIIASLIIAFVIWSMHQFGIYSVIVTIVGIMGIVIGSHMIYKTKIFDSVALTVVYLLLVYIIEFFSMALLGVAVNDTQFANKVTSELSHIRVCYLVLDKAFLSIIYFILEKRCLIKMKIPMRKLCVGIILAGVQVYALIKNTYAHIDSNTFFVWFYLLLLVLAVLYLAIQIMSYVQNNDRLVMALKRNVLLANNYKNEIQRYQHEQIFYHDIKHQFLVLKNYLKNRDFDKAQEYAEQLNSAEMKIPKQRTSISVLDILIEYKRKEAEAHKIHMDIIADAIELKLTECEVVALFGNLFDNAIEACSKIQDDSKWIRVVIRRVQEMTFIKISNSNKEQPLLDEYKFVSIKKEKRMHGLGMTSMKIIVEKYEGNMEVDYDSENFTVMISFFN